MRWRGRARSASRSSTSCTRAGGRTRRRSRRQPDLEIHPLATPAGDEPVLVKHLPGSFTGTALEELLRRHGIERLILSGFMTQMCEDTTARQAAHLGSLNGFLAEVKRSTEL